MNGMNLLAASNLISLIPGLTCMFQVVKFLAALYRVPEGLPSCLPACVRVQCEHGISSLKGEAGRGTHVLLSCHLLLPCHLEPPLDCLFTFGFALSSISGGEMQQA